MYLLGLLGPIGTTELIIILIIALVIFGPKQLPKLGRMFGKTMKEVRSGIDEANEGSAAAEANTAVVEPAPAAPAAPVAPAAPADSAPVAPAPAVEPTPVQQEVPAPPAAEVAPATEGTAKGPITRH